MNNYPQPQTQKKYTYQNLQLSYLILHRMHIHICLDQSTSISEKFKHDLAMVLLCLLKVFLGIWTTKEGDFYVKLHILNAETLTIHSAFSMVYSIINACTNNTMISKANNIITGLGKWSGKFSKHGLLGKWFSKFNTG